LKSLAKVGPYTLIILSLLGLFFAGYLTNQHYLLRGGGLHTPSLCSFNALFNCDAVNVSPYSMMFGYPLSAMGVTFYLVIILLSLYAQLFHSRMGQVAVTWIVTLGFLALIMDFYLAFILMFSLRVICLFCLATYIINLGIFFIALFSMPESLKPHGFLKSLKSAFRSFFLPHQLEEKKSRVFSSFLGVALVIAVSIVGNFIWANQLTAGTNKGNGTVNIINMSDEQLKMQLSGMLRGISKNKENFQLDQSPSGGNLEAPVVLVEFSDFQCPYCQKSASITKEVLNQHPDRVRLVFKNFPLSPQCNSSVSRDMHPKACLFAYASVCARMQAPYDYFWRMHDVIFEKGDRLDKERLAQEAKKMGLNKNTFLECLDSQEAKKAVERDLKLGQTLGINGTPSLFVNGRLLPNPLLSPRVYAALIDVVIEQGL